LRVKHPENLADVSVVRSLRADPCRDVHPAQARPFVASDALALAAAITLVLSATTVVLFTFDSRSERDYQFEALLFGSDLALIALSIIGAGGLRAALGSWRRHACALSGLTLGAALVPGVLAHPSDRGMASLLRLVGAVALGLSLGAARSNGRRLIVGALAVVTLIHVGVAFAERAANGSVGLGSLGEPSAYIIGGRYAATGLTVQPYVLAAWCAVVGAALLAAGRGQVSGRGLTAAAAVGAFAAIGLTMSRAGLLAGALALSALGIKAVRDAVRHRERGQVTTVFAAAGGFVLGLFANSSGWLSRASGSTGSADAISSGRVALLHQAWSLLQDNLLTGVGPGRYVLALSERPELVALSDQSPRPVHLTPLLLVVEGGLVIIPALVLLTIAIGRACLRGGAPAVAVTLAMLPFLALDHLAWSYPQGILLTGIWLGALDLLAQKRGAEPSSVLRPDAVDAD